ncbi:nuclear transport factor 2 family protein [Protaetiibacter mangrovi]|uniref:Nuclear transport factor 2 family protein n=1 Tax=Protaetiibacter mangrovi TaxID=2970926 RepID=A0ABT1ZEY1_9MICO|nr:nuclear transport factor 2 family protein [Protaetiibacter mangrovi]MCS0499275.1 nuclear transport factor 2 family protein [Protaetiibacter mangrovi]
MTERQDFENWVRRYRVAWESNAPDDIRALFTPDGEYLTGPSERPWRGHDEIVANWIEAADQPGDTSYTSTVIAVDGELGVVQLTVDYREGRLYDNIWLVELAADGRARRFTEWYMKRPDSA